MSTHPRHPYDASTTSLTADGKAYVDFDEEEYAPVYPPAMSSKPSYTGSTDAVPYDMPNHQSDQSKDLGFDDRPRSFWSRLHMPKSLACRSYLLVVLVQTCVDLALESDILVQFDDMGTSDSDLGTKRMPVYLIIFAMAHIFQFILAVDAVVFRNTLQFVFLTIFNASILVYACIQITEVRAIFPPDKTGVFSKVPITVLLDIIPIVVAVAEVAYIGLGYKIYTEFGWKVYKFLGADRRIKKMYAQYQFFECMIKFDVFFWIGFSVQFIGLVLSKSHDFQFWLTCAALPLSLLLLLEGHLAARHENGWMMGSFLVGCVAGLGYFCYKFFSLLKNRNDPNLEPVVKTLATFSAIAIILLIMTFVWAVLVMRNFGQGLKTQLQKAKAAKNSKRVVRPGMPANESFRMSHHPNRMSIE